MQVGYWIDCKHVMVSLQEVLMPIFFFIRSNYVCKLAKVEKNKEGRLKTENPSVILKISTWWRHYGKCYICYIIKF